MPEMSPSRLKAIQHPGRRERQGRTSGLIYTPTPQFTTMNQDAYAQATQHQNDLNAFLDYERRLRAAYARSQNPDPRRRLREDSSR